MEILIEKTLAALDTLHPDYFCTYEEKIKAYEYIHELLMMLMNE